MGSRGQSGRYGGGGGWSAPIGTSSLISARERKQKEVDDVLGVLRDYDDKYGVIVTDAQIGEFSGKEKHTVMGYYDGFGNVGVNINYFNSDKLTKAYEDSVKDGFHPSNGSKSAMESLIAHEMGHAVNDELGRRMGMSMEAAADMVVKEALKSTSHRGVVKMENAISRYATANNKEGIAEAFADVYCNGNRAKAESKAIVSVVDKYMLGGK